MFKPILGADIVDYGNPLARGLIGCWLMNEGSGDRVADLSGNGNDGIFQGNTSWGLGERGLITSFDGSGDHISLPSSNILRPSDAITYIACIKTTSAAVDVLLGLSWNPYNHIAIATGKFRFTLHTSSATDLDSTESINDGSYHILHAVYDGSSMYIYHDGLLENSFAKTGTISYNTSQQPRIGDSASGVGSVEYTGDIGCVFLYNRALSSLEVAQSHSNLYQIFDPGFNPAIFGGLAAAAAGIKASPLTLMGVGI